MKTKLEECFLLKAHNESQQGINLRKARSQQGRISGTPLFAQPSKQIDLFKTSKEPLK
jgi:hypothetical protein